MPLFTRPDGDVVRDLPLYRRIMPLLMRKRNESVAYFDQKVDVTRALAFVEEWNATHEKRISLFHVVLYAVVQALNRRPRMNRFVSGGRLWQRRGIWISFSAKKKMDDDSPLFVVKREFHPQESFEAMVERLHGSVAGGRTGGPDRTERELSLLFKLPLLVLSPLVRLAFVLDRWNLLPAEFIHGDPMFASVFIANLGSLKMEAAAHHLYEYGNIPIFLAIGRIERAAAVAPDGAVVARPEIQLRWTYDERIEDGLYAARGLEWLRQCIERWPEEALPQGAGGPATGPQPVAPPAA